MSRKIPSYFDQCELPLLEEEKLQELKGILKIRNTDDLDMMVYVLRNAARIQHSESKNYREGIVSSKFGVSLQRIKKALCDIESELESLPEWANESLECMFQVETFRRHGHRSQNINLGDEFLDRLSLIKSSIEQYGKATSEVEGEFTRAIRYIAEEFRKITGRKISDSPNSVFCRLINFWGINMLNYHANMKSRITSAIKRS